MRLSQNEYDAYVNRRVQAGLANSYQRLSNEVRNVPERTIQDEIESKLKEFGTKCYYVRSRMDKPTTNAVGTPDFIGWITIPRTREMHERTVAFAMEVKRIGQKPTTKQLGKLKWAELAGAKTAVVHSIDEVATFFRSL